MNIKKIYSQNSSVGFDGNNLQDLNFNAIVEELLISSIQNIDLEANNIDLGNGININLTKDTNDEITSIEIVAKMLSQNTPLLPDTTKTIYKNSDIQKVDTLSDYAIKTKDGKTVDKSIGVLNDKGEIKFGSTQTFEFLMLDNCEVILSKKWNITRGTSGEITRIDEVITVI